MTAAPVLAPTLVVPRNGDSWVLTVETREVPAPGLGEITVRVAAAGVNFIDVYQRQGISPLTTPFVLGSEAPGRWSESAREPPTRRATGWPGASIAAARPGSSRSRPRPSSQFRQASSSTSRPRRCCRASPPTTSSTPRMPCSPATRSSPSRGRRSGSAARPARQGQGRDPHRHGGTDEKAAKATALGADHVINYTEVDDLGAAVRELTGGTGVHVVYDGVGTSTFDASLAACDHVARSSSSARPVGRCPRSTSSG